MAFKMRGITPLKQGTEESLHVRGGDSTLSPKELYEKRLEEGNVQVQTIGVNPFNVFKQPKIVWKRKRKIKKKPSGPPKTGSPAKDSKNNILSDSIHRLKVKHDKNNKHSSPAKQQYSEEQQMMQAGVDPQEMIQSPTIKKSKN